MIRPIGIHTGAIQHLCAITPSTELAIHCDDSDDDDDQIITLSETERDGAPLGRSNLINEPFVTFVGGLSDNELFLTSFPAVSVGEKLWELFRKPSWISYRSNRD
jgi:hypothetical protein